jgi:hypothetical protein
MRLLPLKLVLVDNHKLVKVELSKLVLALDNSLVVAV